MKNDDVGVYKVKQTSSKYQCAFTLIELLVVIAIVAALLVVASPLLSNFSKQGMSTSATPLVTTLRLARQYAITHHRNVYVLFPYSKTTYTIGSEDYSAYSLRSYAVVSEVAKRVGNDCICGFEYVSDWKFLPDGIFFNEERIGANIFTSPGPQFPFPASSSSEQTIPAIKFSPAGKSFLYTGARWSDTDSKIYMMQGMRLPGSLVKVTNFPMRADVLFSVNVYSEIGSAYVSSYE